MGPSSTVRAPSRLGHLDDASRPFRHMSVAALRAPERLAPTERGSANRGRTSRRVLGCRVCRGDCHPNVSRVTRSALLGWARWTGQERDYACPCPICLRTKPLARARLQPRRRARGGEPYLPAPEQRPGVNTCCPASDRGKTVGVFRASARRTHGQQRQSAQSPDRPRADGPVDIQPRGPPWSSEMKSRSVHRCARWSCGRGSLGAVSARDVGASASRLSSCGRPRRRSAPRSPAKPRRWVCAPNLEAVGGHAPRRARRAKKSHIWP